MTVSQEAESTVKARHLLVKALRAECFTVKEEEVFYYKKLGENEATPYRADIYASIQFIIELDPPSSHKGDHRSRMDKNRDKNIFNEYSGLRTVRLQPEDVLKEGGLAMAFKEMLSQLKAYEK